MPRVTAVDGKLPIAGQLAFWQSRDSNYNKSSGSAFTPASLTGLVAWYDASTGVYSDAGVTPATNTQTVQQWNDQSGNGYHLKQATGGNRPQFLSAGFNSLPSVTFTVAGLTSMQTTADSVIMGTGLVGSVFGVARITTSGGATSRLVGFIGNGQADDTTSNHSAAWVFVTQATGTMASFRGGFFASDASFFSASTNYRFGNIYDNTNNTNYVNNVAGTPVAATGLTWTSPGAIIVSSSTLGSITCGGACWDGPISELVMTNTALSNTDRTNLDNYFKTKWGL